MTAMSLPSQFSFARFPAYEMSASLAYRRPQQVQSDTAATDTLPQLLFGTSIFGGVSGSARAVERWAQDSELIAQLWLTLQPSPGPAVEHDVAILLPPKRQYMVTINVHYAGRAAPLVNLDDQVIEPDKD